MGQVKPNLLSGVKLPGWVGWDRRTKSGQGDTNCAKWADGSYRAPLPIVEKQQQRHGQVAIGRKMSWS